MPLPISLIAKRVSRMENAEIICKLDVALLEIEGQSMLFCDEMQVVEGFGLSEGNRRYGG